MNYVVRWSYYLGLVAGLVALGWRGLMTLGYAIPERIIMGQTLYDMSFYKGALLLLVVSMASANYADHRERHRHPHPSSRLAHHPAVNANVD